MDRGPPGDLRTQQMAQQVVRPRAVPGIAQRGVACQQQAASPLHEGGDRRRVALVQTADPGQHQQPRLGRQLERTVRTDQAEWNASLDEQLLQEVRAAVGLPAVECQGARVPQDADLRGALRAGVQHAVPAPVEPRPPRHLVGERLLVEQGRTDHPGVAPVEGQHLGEGPPDLLPRNSLDVTEADVTQGRGVPVLPYAADEPAIHFQPRVVAGLRPEGVVARRHGRQRHPVAARAVPLHRHQGVAGHGHRRRAGLGGRSQAPVDALEARGAKVEPLLVQRVPYSRFPLREGGQRDLHRFDPGMTEARQARGGVGVTGLQEGAEGRRARRTAAGLGAAPAEAVQMDQVEAHLSRRQAHEVLHAPHVLRMLRADQPTEPFPFS